MTYTKPTIHYRAYWHDYGPTTPCGWKIVSNILEKMDWEQEWWKRYAHKMPRPPHRTMLISNTTNDPRVVTCRTCRNKLTLLGYSGVRRCT